MSDPVPPSRWPERLAFVVPAALAIACMGNGMGFYDSPELASSGAGLGVTHPPGHPLWVAFSALCSLVPFGAVPFRIALGEAVLLGVLGLLVFALGERLATRVGEQAVPTRAVPWIAFATALTATLGVGVFRQATRVEVYAMAGVLAVAQLALASGEGALSGRARLATLTLGLGAANHHFIALTAAPLTLWVAVARLREDRTAWTRSIVAWAALFAVGIAAYALLPLRAEAAASLPRVHSFGDLIDVASARVFAKNTGSAVPGAPPERALEVLDWLGETLTPVGLLFALGGFYVALRSKVARPDAVRIALLVATVCAARAWLGFVRDNPDAAGYLVPAMAALAVLAASFAAGAWRAVAQAPPPPKGPTPAARALLAVLLVGGPLVLPVWLAARAVRASSVDRSYAPETLTTATLAPLPVRAAFFAYDPQTIFRTRYAMLVEGERPDLTVVPVPLLGYPGMVSFLLRHDRTLVPLIEQYLLRPEQDLSPRGLSTLASQRPVALELDPRNIRANVAFLIPHGPVAEVAPEPTTLATVRGAAPAHFAQLDRLASQLHRDGTARERVDEVLLWRDYTDALFFAERGARAEARRSVARGLEIDPDARELRALADQLEAPAGHPR